LWLLLFSDNLLIMGLPDPAYVVEIDEEGYPIFSGMRSLDDNLNAEILSKMRRSEPERASSRLMTDFDHGKMAWVQAFDDPFVVQSLDRTHPERVRLNFPGDYKVEAELRDFQVDSFGRFHVFIGPHRIPAVMTRKAQAALLHLDGVPEILQKAQFFRSSESPAENAGFWNGLYDQGEDRWELHGVSPAIRSRILQNKKSFGPRICVPAAGRGHEAEFLASQGFSVTALDFSDRARTEFLKIYPRSAVDYQIADAFEYFVAHPGTFDSICEQTFFCAIRPMDRARYWETVRKALKAHGEIFGLFYLKTHAGGPPYGTTEWEIREFTRLFGFEIEEWEIAKDSVARRRGEELWVRLRKKERLGDKA
jgi:hypothetical protein